jgi:ligand-binding sensor domain-containing protein
MYIIKWCRLLLTLFIIFTAGCEGATSTSSKPQLTFNNYTQKTVWVKSMLPYANGVWFGSNGQEGGMFYYLNTSTGAYTTFSSTVGHVINNLTFGQNGLWIATNKGLEYLNFNNTPEDTSDDISQSFTTVDGLSSPMVYGLYADTNGVWVGMNPGGLLYLYTGLTPINKSQLRVTHFTELSNTWVYNITPEGTNGLWLATWGKGLCYLDYNGDPENTSDDRLICFGVSEGLPSNVIRNVVIDNNGIIWVATAQGLVRLDDHGNPFNTVLSIQNFGYAQGLGCTNIYDVAIDNKERVWVATWGRGLFILDNGRWINYTVDDGLASDILLGLHSSNNGMYIASFWGGVSYAKY